MTANELRRRAKLFMAELGRADAMGSLPHRTGDGSLQDALHRFRQRYAPATTIEHLGPEPYGAYANAFAETTKSNRGEGFERTGPTLGCAPRDVDVERTHDGAIGHALLVTHLARAEGRVARAKAS